MAAAKLSQARSGFPRTRLIEDVETSVELGSLGLDSFRYIGIKVSENISILIRRKDFQSNYRLKIGEQNVKATLYGQR
jgi:hypothetical protein